MGRRVAMFIAGTLGVLIIGIVIAFWAGSARENASPDHYDLGVIHQGARVELSARLLAAARTPHGGQIIVLGTSLWWNWIHEYRHRSDNFALMSNVLAHAVARAGSEK